MSVSISTLAKFTSCLLWKITFISFEHIWTSREEYPWKMCTDEACIGDVTIDENFKWPFELQRLACCCARSYLSFRTRFDAASTISISRPHVTIEWWWHRCWWDVQALPTCSVFSLAKLDRPSDALGLIIIRSRTMYLTMLLRVDYNDPRARGVR